MNKLWWKLWVNVLWWDVCDEIYNSSGYLWRVCRSIYHLNFVIKSLWMTLRWRYLKNNNINVSQNNSLKFVMKYILHIWIKLLWKYCGEWRSDEEFSEISVTQFVEVVMKLWVNVLWWDVLWWDVLWWDVLWWDVLWVNVLWWDVLW